MMALKILWQWIWTEKFSTVDDRIVAIGTLLLINLAIGAVLKGVTGSNTWALVTAAVAVTVMVVPLLWLLMKATARSVREFRAYYKAKRDEPFDILRK